jgi:hypothetical protein
MKDDVIEALEEQIVGKGIGNALKVFRERGMLGKNKFLGRNKDQTSE